MVLTLKEVFAKAGDEQVALIQDGPIFYLVLNTKMNMYDPNFIFKVNGFVK